MFIEHAIKAHLEQMSPHVRERQTAKLLEAALRELEDRKVRFIFAMPNNSQRLIAQGSDLYKTGDLKLVWVNEGDLIVTGAESS